MNDRLAERLKFLDQVGQYLGAMKGFVRHPVFADLPAVAAENKIFMDLAERLEGDSLYLISRRLQDLFDRHLAAETVFNCLELETVELAVDWLDQLIALYKENIPGPKSLVRELLYTFDLVERSQGAETLGELLSGANQRATEDSVDLFADDPELKAKDYAVASARDPFAEDPGFGMEFDLLQRTLNQANIVRVDGDDPFTEDPDVDAPAALNNPDKVFSAETKLPFDVFAGDPCVEEKSDQD